MKSRLLKGENKTEKLFLVFGIFFRIIIFIINLIVGGYNCDEVMTSLNAFSLADKLTDINGERLPAYFDTWVIGGQSPFATYLTALSVKLFGNNQFAVRFPALIFSILGLIAFYLFAKEVFKEKRYILSCVGLAAVSPWMVFSGASMLDCNYLAHIMIFALLFLAKGVNSGKTRYYILSSAFFSLCFYCYIASVLLIPFILISLYFILLIKKKISIKNAALSVVTVIAVAIPFILWGLVVTGHMKEFTLFGFNFSKMPGYVRGNDTVFSSGGIDLVINLFMNLVMSFVLLLINDWSVLSLGSNIFGYGFLLSGLILALGLAKLLFTVLKKDKELKFNAKLFFAGAVIGTVCFCALVAEPHLGSLYRYGILSYLLVYLEAIGLGEIGRIAKKIDFKKLVCIYLALEAVMFIGVFAFVYVPQTKTSETLQQEYYGDSFFDCMDFAKENGYDKVAVCKSNRTLMNTAVYERYYCYGDKEFYKIEDELTLKNTHKNSEGYYLVTKDSSVTYFKINEKKELNCDCCIIATQDKNEIKYDKNVYKEKSFGFYSVLYR